MEVCEAERVEAEEPLGYTTVLVEVGEEVMDGVEREVVEGVCLEEREGRLEAEKIPVRLPEELREGDCV